MPLQGLGKTMSVSRRAGIAALAGAAMAVVLTVGSGTAIARADVLDDLAKEFSTASGAGQVANLLNQSLKLRSMGIKPTKAEEDSIQNALNYRPNQTPLVKALQDTVAGQNHRLQEAKAGQQQGGFSIGINQYNPNSPGGVTVGPGGVNIGGGSGQYTIGDGGAGILPGAGGG